MTVAKWGPTGAEREQMLQSFLPLVGRIAARIYIPNPAVIDKEDLISHGVIGLLEAIEKYNPDRDVSFESFVYRRVHGAMIDSIRAVSFSTRTVNDRVKQYREAEDRLMAAGESVTEENVAKLMGLSLTQVRDILGHIFFRAVVSLDKVLYSDDGDECAALEAIGSHTSPNPAQILEEAELRAGLVAALETLALRDRQLLNMYYVEEMTLKEIAAVFEVTEGRVSQLHARALLRLRNILRQGG
ncbi:MAG: RNA polymerase sigma factor FliA [Firmicutes bacterium]|nr:RNA polymerase sigma factor FliA [Bacillota bacterium]